MSEKAGRIPLLPERCPAQGNRFTRWCCRTVLRLFGWYMKGELPNVPKFVAVVAPHTTAWDFAVGMLCIQALGLKLTWMGADWLFRFPFVRALGGIPIDRSQRHGVVGQTIDELETREQMVVVIAPEGSRKKVRWKTGFHHIAKGAGVPLLLVGISYHGRFVELGPTIEAEGEPDDVLAAMTPFYERFAPEYPERFNLPSRS